MVQTPSAAGQVPFTTPLQECLDDLVGLGPKGLQLLEENFSTGYYRTDPLTFNDILRQRADERYTIETGALGKIPNRYLDRFLMDCLDVLGLDGDLAGFYYPEFNLCARVHGGACKLGSVKPTQHYPDALVDAMAELRGRNVITNIGQSGCHSCSGPAIDRLVEDLEEDGVPVLGFVGFSAQANPEAPYLHYESFDSETMSTETLGRVICSSLTAHEVQYEWTEDGSKSIKALPQQ